MSVKKRKNPSGKIVWFYRFDGPGSTREHRNEIREFGFKTQKEAIDAEATRRIEEQKHYEMAKAGAGVAAAVPTTLGALLREFMHAHAEEKLAPKTIERYREQSAYLAPELLAMPLGDLTPLHFNREWARLVKAGGHTRKKEPRPMSAKTVRNIAGVVSSAFSRAIRWGLVTTNPVTNSEPPRVKRHRGIALTPTQQTLVLESATNPWCLRAFLEVVAAAGCRRGEALALRWSDIVDGRATIARSLTQTRDVLEFKSTKSEEPRVVSLRDTPAIAVLEEHRKRQDEFRLQFGADYQADLDLVFANPNGSILKPDSISAAVSLLFRRLKLPVGTSLHSLRHTHTSHLLASGVPLPAVSARLGHSSIRTTQEIYAHMIHGQDDEAAKKWAEYQKQNTAPAPQKGQVQ